jgi:hypothetical protein
MKKGKRRRRNMNKDRKRKVEGKLKMKRWTSGPTYKRGNNIGIIGL